MQSPCAVVHFWDASNVRVLCPYCDEIHTHGLGSGPPWTGQSRRSHCEPGSGVYNFVYPYEQHPASIDLGWEIDRKEARIYAVNNKGRLFYEDLDGHHSIAEDCNLTNDSLYEVESNDLDSGEELSSRMGKTTLEDSDSPPSTGAVLDKLDLYEAMMQKPSFRKKCYISACALCDIHQLRTLFETYEDPFQTAVDREGANGIVIAAGEEHGLKIIIYLMGKGVPFLPNKYGRTALMEAALWGRLDTVLHLTRIGMDTEVRDNSGLTALDLADDVRDNRAEKRNREERKRRAGGIYRERLDASDFRRRIAVHLKRFKPAPELSVAASALPERSTGYFHRTAEGRLTFYKPDTVYEVPNGQSQKAFAQLNRGSNYPVVSAMSGYSHSGWPNVLDNEEWTSKAEELCNLVNHQSERRDISHVEKQLITYYLHKHSAFRSPADSTSHADLLDLQKVAPPLLPEATITVSKRSMCNDCKDFVAKTIAFFRVSINVIAVGDTISIEG